MPYNKKVGIEDVLAWFEQAPLRLARMALTGAQETVNERADAQASGKADPVAVFTGGMQPAAPRRRRTKAEIEAEAAAKVAPKAAPVPVEITPAPDLKKVDPQGRDRQLPLTVSGPVEVDLGGGVSASASSAPAIEDNPFAS
jgi:hypothetical protein